MESKLTELDESRAEILNKIQVLKDDLLCWRSKLDVKCTVYREELSELKNSLNMEVEQLTSEFQKLKDTLEQQQDGAAGVRNLGLPGSNESNQNQETNAGQSNGSPGKKLY